MLQELFQKGKQVYDSFVQGITINKLIVMIVLLFLIILVGYFITAILPYILVILLFVWLFFDVPKLGNQRQKEQSLQIDTNWLASVLYEIIARHSNKAGIVGEAGNYLGNTQILNRVNGVKMFIFSFPILDDEVEVDLDSLKNYLNRILNTALRTELFEQVELLSIGDIPKIQLANIRDENGYRKFFIVWVERREDAEKYFKN